MLSQKLQQKLQQKLSPQQILLMKLLQVPTTALEERIKEEMEVNPALEESEEHNDEAQSDENYNSESENDQYGEESDENFESENDFELENSIKDDFNINDYFGDDYNDDIKEYSIYTNNNNPDNDDKEMPLVSESSVQDFLNEQIGMKNLNEQELKIAQHIIGSLDASGYLERPIYAVVDDLAFTQNIQTDEQQVEKILKAIQSLDPAGVGARNLQECLLLQLQRKSPTPSITLAISIVSKFFEEFSKKHYDKILKKLRITEKDLKNATAEILKLDPKPANSFGDAYRSNPYIEPDFIVISDDGKLHLSINQKNIPDLRVSKTYIGMVEEYSSDSVKDPHKKEALEFVKQKIVSAKWFIDAIKKRENTLYNTMNAIMQYQKDYFLTGNEAQIKPMILKDISELVDLDISTISRVANSKYVQTPYGIFKLKSFFSESMSTESGDEVSTREIKKILKDCIEFEDKSNPLTDEELMDTLHRKGYNIARRTVAKYREHLGIQVARLRKTL